MNPKQESPGSSCDPLATQVFSGWCAPALGLCPSPESGQPSESPAPRLPFDHCRSKVFEGRNAVWTCRLCLCHCSANTAQPCSQPLRPARSWESPREELKRKHVCRLLQTLHTLHERLGHPRFRWRAAFAHSENQQSPAHIPCAEILLIHKGEEKMTPLIIHPRAQPPRTEASEAKQKQELVWVREWTSGQAWTQGRGNTRASEEGR